MATPLSLVEWFVSFYEATTDPEGPAPLEGTCAEGELIFVPRGWWHAAMNLEVRASVWMHLSSVCSHTALW